jgi:hypothetical protein
MRRAHKLSSISPKARGTHLMPKRRRSNLHTKATKHHDVISRRWPRRLLEACHSRNASGVDASSHPTRMLSNTGVQLQKEQEEERWAS